MPRKDPEKNKAYFKKWWQQNKETQRARVAANNIRFRKEMQALKMLPCVDCGFVPKVSGQMEWDHIGTDKVANVSLLVNKGNRRLIAEEIAKCELVCRNCHALRTALRIESGRDGQTAPIL